MGEEDNTKIVDANKSAQDGNCNGVDEWRSYLISGVSTTKCHYEVSVA